MLLAPAKDATKETILNLAWPRIKPGSTVYTDSYVSYKVLDILYKHEFVNHSIGGVCPWRGHINTCEGEFSIFRPFMTVYRGVEKYNVPLYASLLQLNCQLRQMNALSALEHTLKTILFLPLHKPRTKRLSKTQQQHSYL